jgi:hypothetical protein
MHYSWETPPDRWALLRTDFRPTYGGERIGPLARLAAFQAECREFTQDTDPEDITEREQQWLRAVPFIRMPNSDFLALDPALDPVDPPVIYLCHDDDNWLLARNFAAFLHEWEQLCYIGPEIWVLKEFCNRRTGCLDSETAKAQALRDLFSDPLHSTSIQASWRSTNVMGIANAILADCTFDLLPVLADALIEAGCDDETILAHCRQPGHHVRGCWVVDLILASDR